MSSVLSQEFKTLLLRNPIKGVLQVSLNRPDKLNSMNPQMWIDLRECFNKVKFDNEILSIVLTGQGRAFCSGLDLKTAEVLFKEDKTRDIARKAIHHRNMILEWQASLTAIEHCDKPVIAYVQNACIGAGIDMITACDIRQCSEDAYFSVKEVDIGMAADVGTLQRLPKVVGNDSWVREIVYTARSVSSTEALQFGLVSRVFKEAQEGLDKTIELAAEIASKSPVAIVGSKRNLLYSRDHTVQEGLEYNANWNTIMHNTNDIAESLKSMMLKQKPKYEKL
ncbi:Delta(3,5)-Delta(2,4)-dienoyl-CoA isomerase, mitochondrial [Zancudomyces culisetae]|uniref:Delta(3,5)-Delta(2,4)-dienoyl-CoA isomerase, mitochondrial n=1 Tax=Zancudomyces culisetae TaxID=1213189 RepID=A0A1R1PYR5_ZANCU|nr:Delta(3,5)-Delta(2,4)-dienoyl-CoA isomerase, mitochondrial [Zancudomyces culisetae]|eukprot:OMH86108.1 Delta(3,5)-Delta(2,4)-dienoyl-CoA isomerase, mitochondrial [Zancudomyces culisetae]